MQKKASLFLILATSWLIVVTVLLTLPGSSLPSENWMSRIHLDKWVHIGLFAVMTVLWSRTFIRRRPGISIMRVVIFTGLSCIAYGVAMEFVQKYFIPGRSYELADMAADSVGVVLGVAFILGTSVKK